MGQGRWRWRHLMGVALAMTLGASLLAACSRSGPRSGASALSSAAGASGPARNKPIPVVAAENFWGSIAAQLGGDRAHVTSIVSDPNADPHQYEANSADARLFAQASLVVTNGAGYDDWATKLLDANPSPHRLQVNVARLVGKKTGDNPHLWYSLDYVNRAADRITADYQAMDPADSSYFAGRRRLLGAALGGLTETQMMIRSVFGGTKVAATESIVVYLFQALGLDLISPEAFMRAVSDGTDPAPGAVATFFNQIKTRSARILAYNSQTATAVTTDVKRLAEAHHVPVVAVTETIQPPGASYQTWMAGQLQAIRSALQAGAG
ncbi:MAG: metal ABC transporter solute-binding protein, Zn/Mn family [Acidimicrobiales bacterium]